MYMGNVKIVDFIIFISFSDDAVMFLETQFWPLSDVIPKQHKIELKREISVKGTRLNGALFS